jgi:hypothetical protein
VSEAPAVDVRTLLRDGKTVRAVAEMTGWPRQRITALINGTHDMFLDAATDTGTDRRPAGRAVPAPADDDDQDDDMPAPPVPVPPGTVDALLAAAEQIDDKGVVRALATARTAVDRLREVVTTINERRAAEQEVAQLQKQLAAARERARQLTARPRRGPTTEIRAWAKQVGIDVPDRGRIPAAVVTQFEAAHRGKKETR